MYCTKCGAFDENSTYCPECGERLREPCPECGEMEPIGRPVCETERNKAKRLLRGLERSVANRFESYRSGGVIVLLLVTLVSALSVILTTFKGYDEWVSTGIACIFAMVGGILMELFLSWLNQKKLKVMEKERQLFWQEHPDMKRDWDRWTKWEEENRKRWEKIAHKK